MNPDIPRVGPAFPDFADAPFKKVDVAAGHYTAKTHSALEPEGAFSVGILMIG